MKTIMKRAAALAIPAAVALSLSVAGPIAAFAQSDNFTEGQTRSIEKIVKDYLVSHPEILLEVQDAFEKKAEAKRGEATRSRMPEFYRSLASLKSELAPLTIGEGDVTLVEFFDYNCGYCRHALPQIMKLLDADTKVKVVFMEYPILSQGSTEATKIALAAAKQGKYFDFHKAMLAAGRANKESALKVAEQIGLDMEKVKADSASPETEALVAKIGEIGKRMFVDGTPTFVVGDKVTPGAADFDTLKRSVDDTRKDGCKACAEAASTTGEKGEKKS
ncbi:DsbA family protein [Rhodomicrobium sp. Az07]|uniref:DsbA family protein n=1 Tax=Rhodomicrobium sp. Az07 TaxID=2839034 RepID=UPI001BEBE60B|nr:DsbA family protein [Rhodomicrobium sp. Az07]MBT3070699.1 DsbA family protein [Rhodomicrobium sp. Az07]